MDKAMCKRTIAVYQAQPGCNKPVWFKSNTVHVWLPMFGWFLGPMSGRTYHTSWSSGHRAIGQTTTNHKLGISYRMAPPSCKWVYKPWNNKTSSWNIYHKHHVFFATVKALRFTQPTGAVKSCRNRLGIPTQSTSASPQIKDGLRSSSEVPKKTQDGAPRTSTKKTQFMK